MTTLSAPPTAPEADGRDHTALLASLREAIGAAHVVTEAQDMAARMLELGVYVIGFSFPVVPRGAARIRTQMSAAHTFEQIDQVVAAFKTAGKELGVIK